MQDPGTLARRPATLALGALAWAAAAMATAPRVAPPQRRLRRLGAHLVVEAASGAFRKASGYKDEPPPQHAAHLFHAATKHGFPDHYAPGPSDWGELDWDEQPDTSRRFVGAPELALPGRIGDGTHCRTPPLPLAPFPCRCSHSHAPRRRGSALLGDGAARRRGGHLAGLPRRRGRPALLPLLA